MQLHQISCNFCNKSFFRSKRQINETEKFGWRQFCSKECHSSAKNKQKNLICSNPLCNKEFIRRRYKNTINDYCSQSCAAIINNKKFPKIYTPIKFCSFCKKAFKSKEKYCSIACKNKNQIIGAKVILQEITLFYQKNGRIPFKREYHHYTAARRRFKSWNNAIQSAGLEPNPVMFAKKHIAKDGHTCDSLAEKIIDDWLFARKVLHERSIPYPQEKKFSADFLVGDYFIEFFGLHGQHKRYDYLRRIKLDLATKSNIQLIEVYPHHLFPKNKLYDVLNKLL